MAVNTSTVSDPIYTTVVVDTESDTTLETFNDANTTLYMIEGANPNEKAVWSRIQWAASGGATSTQHDMILYFPANSVTHYVFGGGFQILTGNSPHGVQRHLIPERSSRLATVHCWTCLAHAPP
mgnify:CR=1 FL=1